MKHLVRAVWYFVTLVVATAFHGGRSIVAGLFGVRQRLGGVYDRSSRGWGRWLLAATGIRVRVVHPERFPATPAVYVANHVSLIDIWVLLRELPGSVRFLFKKEMLAIPVFGRALKAAGHISIDRKNQTAAFGAYDRAAASIRGGISAAIFAEGTRSRDGTLQPFKKGPFVLAIKAGVPVIPLYLGGTYALLPPGRRVPRRGEVTLVVGEPIATASLGLDDRDALARRCRDAVIALSQDPSSPSSSEWT